MYMHRTILINGYKWQPDVYTFLATHLKPGLIFCDVGANVGMMSVYASKLVGSTGYVYSFEPDVESYRYLSENTRCLRNIMLIQSCVSNIDGVVEFYSENTGINSSVVPEHVQYELKKDSTRSVLQYKSISMTLDSFFSSLTSLPDVVKIDVEGGELLVLQGMVKMIESKRPILIVEVTRNAKGILDFLEKYYILSYHLDNRKNVLCLPR